MKQLLIYSTLFAAMALHFACTKHAGDYKEKIPVASIIVEAPLEGAIYNQGDTVIIKAKAISSAVIHGYDISIKAKGDTALYFFAYVHDHNDNLAIEEKWKNTLSGNELELAITLALDHEGHTLTRKVKFKAN